MEKTKKKSIKGKMIRLALLPVIVLAITAMTVSVETFRTVMVKQVEKQMEQQCDLVEKLYDQNFPGEYGIQMHSDGTYEVLKGGNDISNAYEIIDAMKNTQNVEISIFCKGVRVLTTVKDENGNRLLSTKASAVVVNEIETTKKSQFYRNVEINNVDCLAYYEPIILADGTYYGMIGICRPVEDIKKAVVQAMIPVAGVFAFATVLIGFIALYFAGKIIDRIKNLQKFMTFVSKADFTATIDPTLLKSEDELGELAQVGMSMQKSLKRLVEQDALTGLNNRRFGDMILKKMDQQLNQYCVCIGDIDFFKRVNDTYGHEAGDLVLKAVANVLRKEMVGKGFAVRWGGEEFLILFKNIGLAEAVSALEKILDEIRKIEVVHKNHVIHVTMSLGVVENGNGSIDDYLRYADACLYRAKENGRNQIQYMENGRKA